MKSITVAARSLLATAMLFAPLVVQPVHAISSYTVTSLGGQLASRLNEQGDVVGWGVVNGNPRAYVYTAEDSFVYLELPAGMTHSMAEDVSDRDVDGRIHIVGSAYPDIFNEPGKAYRWTFQPGVGLVETTLLGTVGTDPYSVARGINSSGEIVGESDPRSLFGGGMNAFLYDDVNGMRTLDKGKPQEINDSGQIVGYSGAAPNVWRISGGVLEDLGKPAESRLAFAYAINEFGSISGSALLPSSSQERLARYSDAVGWELLGGIGTKNIGWGINNSGTVVGEGVADLTGLGLAGVIYADDINRVAYIADFLEASESGWSIFAAYDINNAGQIAAYGVRTVNGVEQGGGLLLQPTQVQQAPAAPSNLVGNAEANGIQLTWSDNSDNELVFRIWRRAAGAADFTALTTSSFATYHDSSVANCSTYDYRVSAFNDAGDSAFSNTVNVSGPCVQPPEAPMSLSASNDYYAIQLTWDQGEDLANVDNFEIQRDAGQGFVTVETATIGEGYIDNSAQLCEIYNYRVRAVNVGGASGYSNTFEIDTACPVSNDIEAPVVTIATPIAGAEVNAGEVLIEASASDTGAITAMAVEINDQRVCTVTQSSSIDCAWTTRTYVAGAYTIRVVAFDAEGNAGSAEVSITLLDTLTGGGKGDRSLSQATDSADSSDTTEADELLGGGGSLSWWMLLLGLGLLPLRRRLRD